jgi:hypothetical protein
MTTETIVVLSEAAASAPFAAPWTNGLTGYIGPAAQSGAGTGSANPNAKLGNNVIVAVGISNILSTASLVLSMAPGTPTDFITSVAVTLFGAGAHTYNLSAATYYPPGAPLPAAVGGNAAVSLPGPTWIWTDPNADFAAGQFTTMVFAGVVTTTSGQGDITDPEAWIDEDGNIPPLQYNNVPTNTNYPNNGDGRYWFIVDAETPTNGPINFIGDPEAFVDSAVLQWTVTQVANDGSSLVLGYSVDGTNYISTTLGPNQQQKPNFSNGVIIVPLAPGGTAALQLYIKVTATGGTPSPTAQAWQVACAVTRNVNEGLAWDGPNPYNPTNYNGSIVDTSVPTDTLANLRRRIMVRLGFSNQADNPPPGMTALVNDFLTSAQTYLYRRYLQLSTKRMFRWKINPGQRFYSLRDADQDILAANALGVRAPQIDVMKRIEWAGIQDTRNVWYPLIQGIPPQLYTMITKPWRPARYEIRQGIEVYPMPDQTYWLWFRAHFGLMQFIEDTDTTTIDCELVFLHALANAKSHYGQPDANNIEAQANAYRAELIAATHQTAHYIPGTIAVPPAVRPTLIQFDNNPAA